MAADPGAWRGRFGVAVDLMVPEALSGRTSSRSARLPIHGDRAAPGRPVSRRLWSTRQPKDGLDVLRLLQATASQVMAPHLAWLLRDPWPAQPQLLQSQRCDATAATRQGSSPA